jgi:hypothetical protein
MRTLNWLRQFLGFWLLLAGIFAGGIVYAEDCKTSYKKLNAENKTITADEVKEIVRLCGARNSSEELNTLINNPEIRPIQLLYLSFACKGERTALSYKLDSSLSNSLNALVDDTDNLTWKKLNQAKPDFKNVPVGLRNKWKKRALADLDQVRKRLERGINDGVSEEQFIWRLSIAKHFMGEEEIKSDIRLLSERISQYFSEMHGYEGIPLPKLYQFAKQSIRRELGLDYVPLTEMVATQEHESVHFKILSVDPARGIGDELARQWGVAKYDVLAESLPREGRSGKKLIDRTKNWQVGDRKYKAEYSVTLGPEVEKIAPALRTLNYDGLWADKKLTGMIFPGANMGRGTAGGAYVMDAYREYFEEAGFRFGAGKPVQDFRKYLGEEVSSGRLDYLFKEAHSEGDDNDLLTIINNGKIVTGKKRLKDGNEEVVHLFYPDYGTGPQKTGEGLKYEEFNSWMRERDKAKGKQLFYVDATCYGLGVACKLASAAQNEKLVVAGSTGTVDTFTNDPHSGLVHILDGIRNRKSFAQITQKFEEHSTADVYHFPADQEWQNALYGRGTRSTEVKIDFFEDGKKVNLETVGR